MAEMCTAKSCTRFEITQWMIGIGILTLLAVNGIVYSMVDRMEVKIDELKESVISHVASTGHGKIAGLPRKYNLEEME